MGSSGVTNLVGSGIAGTGGGGGGGSTVGSVSSSSTGGLTYLTSAGGGGAGLTIHQVQQVCSVGMCHHCLALSVASLPEIDIAYFYQFQIFVLIFLDLSCSML